ncbi:FAD-binding oxidoreductase [Actinoplanes sichuanensis]|nr:FAD-binding oxidoreductase [Actinoplanes sichuanensis]
MDDTAALQRTVAVVGVTSASDVQAAVRSAAYHRRPVIVAESGAGAPAGSVVIDTSRMREIHIDPETRTARVGAGVCWQQAQQAAAHHDLTGLAASSGSTRVVGYTAGGGLSPVLGRRYGFAADHVRAVELVSADGELRRVDAVGEPDLFWALCGGGSELGVITALEFALYPHAHLYGGDLCYAAEHSRAVLDAYREVAAAAPEDLTVSFAFLRMPDLPSVAPTLRGRFGLAVRVAWLGAVQQGEQLVRPLLDAAPRTFENLTEMPFTDAFSVHGDPGPAAATSRLLGDLTDQAVDALLSAAGPGRDFPAETVEVRQLGGALSRSPRRPNAVAGRDARFRLSVSGLDRRTSRPHLRELLDTLSPWIIGPHTVDDRLREIKAAHDPANLFRTAPTRRWYE